MNEMTFQLCTDGGTCLYEQIYEHIKKEIKGRKLLPGEKLPSTRFLAEYLQVARSTVDYAYGQLLSEGYIESKPCKGYFVCPIEEGFGEEPEEVFGQQANVAGTVFRQREKMVQKSSSQKGDSRQAEVDFRQEKNSRREESVVPSKSLRQEKEALQIDFSPYEIDMSGFPFSVWKKISKNIMSYANSDLFARGEPQGDYALRQTISRYLHSSRGVNCRPEQIVVGAGNDYLLLLLEKVLGRHVRIAMENPTYQRSYRIFRSFDYHIATVDMDEWGMRADKLEETEADIAYVMPSHQFPTGTVMPIGRRLELLKWADGGADRYLIEDDYDSEFRFQGKPIPALQASDRHGKVIYMGTFSKAIAPAIRIGFMVLPDSLLEKYIRDCSFYSCSVSRIDQNILNEFIRDGYFERHLNKMRKVYRAKHGLLLESLQPFKDAFAITGQNAGLHLVLTSRAGVTEGELLQKAALQGVRAYGLSESIVEEAQDSTTVLLGFGGLSATDLEMGVKLLQKAWL